MPTHSSSRPIVWLMIVIILGLSFYVTYRLSNYFLSRAAVNKPSPVAAKPEHPALAPVKSPPIIGGALIEAGLHIPDAEYPSQTTANGTNPSGKVTVEVRVNRKGMVTSARALDGDAALRPAAEKAAKNAAFSPEKMDRMRNATGTITYTFIPPSPVAAATPKATQAETPTVTKPASEAPTTGGPLAGTELNLSQPQYPSSARPKGAAETVTILIRVNRAGKVISWRTLEFNDKRLRDAALAAAKKSTFAPAKLPGNGEVVGTITYRFNP